MNDETSLQPDERVPDVTVVIGAYNSMPYLLPCLASVASQSIGADRLEVIAVDDGSTDNTGEILDAYARLYPFFRVVHQANSGGPSAPRNLGIDQARGRYIFFVDADDMLGVEALERMVAMADKNQSDIVLGKLVGIRRSVPVTMYTHNQPNADLYTSKVYRSLRCQRLFRRSFLIEHDIRFPHMMIGEDQNFAATAYIHAKVISVLADYDCYYLRLREDGQNITTAILTAPRRMAGLESLIPMVADLVPAGPKRDLLMRRHFAIDMPRNCFRNDRFGHHDLETKIDLIDRARKLMADYYTPAVAEGIPSALHRVMYHLIGRGMHNEVIELITAQGNSGRGVDIVDNGRIYAAWPFFRDPDLGVPDALYDCTEELKVRHRLTSMRLTDGVLSLSGHAYVDHLPTTDPDTQVVLHGRSSGVEHVFPVVATAFGSTDVKYDYSNAGFTADIDLMNVGGKPLRRDIWDVYLDIRAQGVSRRVRFGQNRSPIADGLAESQVIGLKGTKEVLATPYFTAGDCLSIDVGGVYHKLEPQVVIDRALLLPALGFALAVTGHVDCTKPERLRDSTLTLVAELDGKVVKQKPIKSLGARRDFIVTYRPGPMAFLAWRKKRLKVYVDLQGGDFTRRAQLKRDEIRRA